MLWTSRARLAFCALGLLSVPTTSSTVSVALVTLSLIVVGVSVALYGVRASRRGRGLTRAGLIGISFDMATLIALPVSWYYSAGGYDAVSSVFLVKSDILPLGLVFLGINAMALRPAYPLIVSGTLVAQQLAFLFIALCDPRVALTTDPVATHLMAKVHLAFFAWQQVSVLFLGALLAFVVHSARKTIEEAVALEVERLHVERRQAELILEGKMNALSRLVAGITHEINTPLGALVSSVNTASSASLQLEQGEALSDRRVRSARAERLRSGYSSGFSTCLPVIHVDRAAE